MLIVGKGRSGMRLSVRGVRCNGLIYPPAIHPRSRRNETKRAGHNSLCSIAVDSELRHTLLVFWEITVTQTSSSLIAKHSAEHGLENGMGSHFKEET